MAPAVSLRDAGVRFTVPRRTRMGKTPRLVGAGRWTLWGLRGASLDVAPGEVVGLIGPNGSGKTTLLRTVAGIYVPDEGTVAVRGRVAPILSLSAGLIPQLSGFENVALSAALLDVPRRSVPAFATEIAEFAGLEEFTDAPVRVYSSGMRARLGFAIAALSGADVFVLDEVLSVGDQEFRARSRAKIEELIRGGKTVLMAGHDRELLSVCERIVRLDGGRIVDHDDRNERAAGLSSHGHVRPSVSVIVAAYNEERYLADCLDSLGNQTYGPVEVVVVDDGSSDRTAEIASAAGVRVLRQAHEGAGIARNRGAEAATGEILVFFDGDMTAEPAFIERLVAPIVERAEIGTFTKEIFVGNGDRRWARAHQLGRRQPLDTHFPSDFPERWENFRAVRRVDFLRVGGFDRVGHGEDVTLGRKLGATAVAAPGAVCHHNEPDTLGDIYRSARWYGRGQRIAEGANPLRDHTPWRSAGRAVRLARRHRMPSLLLYRSVWDFGVMVGWLTRGGRRAAAK